MSAAAYDFNNMDPFFRDLGDLQAKFMSLEYNLRTFLFLHSGRPFMQDMESVAVGDSFEENEFTNYDTLPKLVAKYNDVVRLKNAALVIHPSIVEIRDALAHGRLYRRFADRQSRLLKFSKPDKATGRVRAETVETLDPATLLRWNTFMFKASRQVWEALADP